MNIEVIFINTTKLKNYEKYIPLILRLGLGFIWVYMGLVPKLLYVNPEKPGMPMALSMVKSSGINSIIPIDPTTLVHLLGVVELVLGILLILGLFTRIASASTIVLMLIFMVVLSTTVMQSILTPLGNLLLKDISLIAASIVLIITGGGELSVDNLIRKG